MERLSLPAMELLLELSEQPIAQVSHTMLMRGSAKAARELVNGGWLVEGESLDSVTCEACHDDHAAEVEFDPDQGFQHYCPHEGWVVIAADRLRRYRVDLNMLICWIAAELGVARARNAVEVRAGAFWDLGDVRLEKRARPTTLMVVAGGPDFTDLLADVERRRRSSSIALLVLGKAPGGRAIPVPGLFACLSLWECRRAGIDHFQLDPEILRTRVHGTRDPAADQRVTHTDGFYNITVDGRVFQFTGPLQRDVIRQLHEASRTDKPKVGVQHLLEEAGSRARKLSELFKGHQDWSDLIVVERGLAWLRVDDALPDH